MQATNESIRPSNKIDFVGKEDIFRDISGEGNLEKVGVKFIEDRSEKIKHHYSTFSLLNRLPKAEYEQVCVSCIKINALEIVKTLGGCTTIGAFAGALIGWFIPAPSTAFIGGAIGGTCGLGTGAYICYEKKLYHDESYVKTYLSQNSDYLTLMYEKETKEYKLLLSFFLNYIEQIPASFENEMYDFLCCLTREIPEVPVFSPHDVDRKHPYEKKEIEEFLGIIEEKANLFRKDAIEQGFSQEYINNTVANMMENSCPFRLGAFKANQLVYDTNHVKKTIVFLQKIVADMSKNLTSAQDPLLQEALGKLIDHYRSQYTEATDKIISELKNDIWRLRADFDTAEKVSEEYRLLMNKV